MLHAAIRVALIVTLLAAAFPQSPESLRLAAEAALRHGRAADAERLTRLLVARTPRDPAALGFLAVVLDEEKRYAEAEPLYQQAVALAKPSAALLKNLTRHYLLAGQLDKARGTVRPWLDLNPTDADAHLLMAQLELERGDARSALEHVRAIPAPANESLAVFRLRAEALAKSGDYEGAEGAFSRVLAASPGDFATLYNLGLAAVKAGHVDRAQQAFESALRQRPGDPDCLLNLGRIYASRNEYTRALARLVEAGQAAPDRADIALATARACDLGGYYGDAVSAYERYLALRPDDYRMRRDYALACASAGAEERSIAVLERYIAREPSDALGGYYLGLVLQKRDPDRSLVLAATAARLDPALTGARLLQAQLLLNSGSAVESRTLLVDALQRDPGNADLLTQLGLTCLALEQPTDAEATLRKALALSPDNPVILLSLGKALVQLGRNEEAHGIFARSRVLRATAPTSSPVAGALDWLRLSPAEQNARAIVDATNLLAVRPSDAVLRVKLGKLLLSAGRRLEARQAFTDILERDVDPATAEDAGRALLFNHEADLALKFFELASSERPASRLGSALAFRQMGQPARGLALLEHSAGQKETSEFPLVRALLFEDVGEPQKAVAELNAGFAIAIVRPELALEAARLLVSLSREADALTLLRRACDDGVACELARAWLLSETGKPGDAITLVRRVQVERPEIGRAYAVEGLLLEKANRPEEARKAFRTAGQLGETSDVVMRRLSVPGATQSAAPGLTRDASTLDLVFCLEKRP